MIVRTTKATDNDRVLIQTPNGNECKMLIRSRYEYDDLNKPLGNKITVICRTSGHWGWHRKEWFDFVEEKDIGKVVDELFEKYHCDEAWGFFDAIETRA